MCRAWLLALGLLIALPATDPAPAVRAHGDHPAPELTINQPWARTTGTRTQSAAVYFTLENAGGADRLIAASTPRAAMTQIHRSYERDGTMVMEQQDGVPVPEGDTVTFAPGGLHIMMMRLSKPLTEGEHFPLTLTFEHKGDVQIMVTVTGMAGL
ncbi:copper chaperone PCu(A)C [Yunchengibacter salinarum]|uniref:copper chaperone PCu(A)C n=1 Tax=Yunchengibacter salinarum TaxID=3133399 RepID=UPI0035B608B5